MAVLPVLEYPHPVLLAPAKPVHHFDDAFRLIVGDMIDTLYKEEGAGLAANQVGIALRIFVVDISPDEEKKPLCFVNPEIIATEGQALYREGCLSIPGTYFNVKRAVQITLNYQDENGEHHTLTTDGRLAHCIQHELDHLNGIVSFDRLSPLKRMLALKKWEKSRKRGSVA